MCCRGGIPRFYRFLVVGLGELLVRQSVQVCWEILMPEIAVPEFGEETPLPLSAVFLKGSCTEYLRKRGTIVVQIHNLLHLA